MSIIIICNVLGTSRIRYTFGTTRTIHALNRVGGYPLIDQQSNISEKALTKEAIISWCKTLMCKPSTKKKKLLVIRNFAKYLVSLGFNAFIPEIPRASSDYVPYVFSEEEWLRIIDSCDNLSCGHSYSNTPVEFPLFVRMLYGCGLRLNEALSLQMKDIDLDGGTLTIRQAKRNRQRFVPMSKSLTEICRLYCQRMCLIPNGDRIKKPDLFPESHYSPHSFRHSIAVHMLEAEIPLPVIKNFLGHSSIETTLIYTTVSEDLANKYLCN
jgi:integrase/recombinase XerD